MLYAPGPYSLALGLAEIPYLVVQSIVMVRRCGMGLVLQGRAQGAALHVGMRRMSAEPVGSQSTSPRHPLPCRCTQMQVNITYWAVQFSSTGWKFGYFLLMFSISLLMYT